ncbi:MAG TPA: hypothetical protein VML55_15325, partial [Planctomycetaceae bacterium]|nr:hypothetical protein [Planctomycetaceae bacterium]
MPDVVADLSAPAGRHKLRYATGELLFEAKDLVSHGYGLPWGHTRRFSSRLSRPDQIGNGVNWQVQEWPYLVRHNSGVAVLGMSAGTLWFDPDGGNFTGAFGIKQTLVLDSAAGVYRLTDLDGSVIEFDDLTGMFQKHTRPGGETIQVTATAAGGFNVAQVERSFTDSSGSTITEQLWYEYDRATGDDLLVRVTLRRKVDSGAWSNVARAVYTYYGSGESNELEGDLKTAATETWKDGAWAGTGTTHYRYWTSAGLEYQLQYVLNPASYARMAADGLDPLTASEAQVALYADFYYEYDSSRRVTKEMIEGGSRTYLFAYAQSTFSDGYNRWKTKSTETLPDGSQNIVYSNFAGQPMLKVFQAAAPGTGEWIEFFKYSDDAQLVLHALPSAVSGYDENYADLLVEVSGNYQYLKDNAGLVRTYEYHAASGYVSAEKVQQGELGTPIPVQATEYVSQTEGGRTVWLPSKEIVYPDAADPLKTIETSFGYTFHDGTCAVKEKTTTLPVVPTSQNGSGVADTRREYFDLYGNLVW